MLVVAARQNVPLRRSLLFPVQGTLLQCVNISDHQDCDKAQHTPEDQLAVANHIFENNRPWIHEHDFEIEENKEHRNQIEFYAKAWLHFSIRHHSTLVGGIFNA